MKLAQKMFSILNDYSTCQRVITILGLSLRIKSGRLILKKRIYLRDRKIEDLEKQKTAILKNYQKQIPLKNTYKYIHIMYNEKFNKPFVDFLNTKFNPDEHLFLCNRRKDETPTNPFPEGENVYEYVNNLEETLKYLNIDLFSDKFEKIILHSLLDKDAIQYLYDNKKLLNKSYWFIWSSDLYNAPDDEVNNYVRKNFKGYISDTDGDAEYAKVKYQSDAKIFHSSAIYPITKEMLEGIKKEPKNSLRIQINNSCDDTIIDMLRILSKFKKENITVSCILSYGNNMDLKNEIIKTGKNIFKDKFEYIDEYMSPQDFTKYLGTVDILILNRTTNRGHGNAYVASALGSKLFIRQENNLYMDFKNKGVEVFDTEKIKDMPFEEFISYPENTKQSNIKNTRKAFDYDYLASLWDDVFNG